MLGTPHQEASGLWLPRGHGCVSWGFSGCFPCCFGACLAGYLLSADPVAGDSDVPDLVVLATPLGASLNESVPCVRSGPEFVLPDVVAMTDGAPWRIYDRGRLIVEVDVIRMRRGTAAGILTEWLGRANYG